jgi:hypothetical protein
VRVGFDIRAPLPVARDGHRFGIADGNGIGFRFPVSVSVTVLGSVTVSVVGPFTFKRVEGMMVSLLELWLPILLSTILIFMASALMWMVMPHHRTDWQSMPNGEQVQEMLKGVPPGQYIYPGIMTREVRNDKAAQERYQSGMGFVIVREPKFEMGKQMGLSFLHYLVVSTLIAYVAASMVPSGVAYLTVFRVVGAAAILAYTGALASNAIWWGNSWSSTIKNIFDGVVYGLLTAGVFAWLWP